LRKTDLAFAAALCSRRARFYGERQSVLSVTMLSPVLGVSISGNAALAMSSTTSASEMNAL
jgi:hypothetical protein